MGIADEVKKAISIKFKERHDSYTDQFSRIVLMKLMLVFVAIIAVHWFDKIDCILSTKSFSEDFIKKACWINGLYIYEDIAHHLGNRGYYGIPGDLNYNGIDLLGNACNTLDNQTKMAVSGCIALKKTFFLQYQYMLFVVIVLASIYYLPYIVYLGCNSDLVSLRGTLTNGDGTAKSIRHRYFDHKLNSMLLKRMRVMSTFGVKILYVIVNVIAFLFLDEVLNGKYRTYGSDWLRWNKLGNYKFNYVDDRNPLNPAKRLLPSFAICEVFEEAANLNHTVMNSHMFVCTISIFISYQYILLIVWFVQVMGIFVSSVGFIMQIVGIVMTAYCSQAMHITHAQKAVYGKLSIREREYIHLVRKKNEEMYRELVNLLCDGQPVNNPTFHGPCQDPNT